MAEITLKRQLADRFREVNGDHPMTAADDAYVTARFTVLEAVCAAHGRDADEIRRLMLAQHLPLPAYLRSDGAEMVPADLFALANRPVASTGSKPGSLPTGPIRPLANESGTPTSADSTYACALSPQPTSNTRIT